MLFTGKKCLEGCSSHSQKNKSDPSIKTFFHSLNTLSAKQFNLLTTTTKRISIYFLLMESLLLKKLFMNENSDQTKEKVGSWPLPIKKGVDANLLFPPLS